jgi:hypothetical protein
MTLHDRAWAGGFRGPFGAPRSRLSVAVDVSLVGAAVAAAIGSVAFAGVMLARADHKPAVNGMEYLAIFAQPRLTPKPPTPEPPPRPAAPMPVGDLDMTPIGSIQPLGPEQAGGFTLVAAQPGVAWVREGARIFAVRPGDEAPGLGRVARIVARDGRWILVGESGSALLSSAKTEGKDAAGPPPDFGKRMIFGSP